MLSCDSEMCVDHKASQHLSLQANLKQTAVHGHVSPRCSTTCFTLSTMPTLPEDKAQPKEAQHTGSTPAKDTTVEVTTRSRPSVVLPENAVTSDVEIDKNMVNRPRSPHRRHSNRTTRNPSSSLTSVDNAGHVIDLVNDQLPDVKISEEDKKKNLELLEEAKKVSERFLMRRGRKSRSSLPESPTAVSPTLSPKVSPVASRSNSLTLPVPSGSDVCTTTSAELVSPGQNNRIVKEDDKQVTENAAKGLIDRRQNDQRKISQGRLVPRSAGFENAKEKLSEQKENFDPRQHMDTLPKSSTAGSDGGRMSVNTCVNVCENELGKLFLKKAKEKDVPLRTHLPGPGIGNIDQKLKIPIPEMRDHKVECKPEFKVCGLRPPLLRAVSWDSLEPGQKDKTPFKLPSEEDRSFAIANKSSNQLKASAFKDLQIQVQPVRMQKLTKLREEHILMRNQNLVGLKLPELSEAAEQEKGPSPLPSPTEEDETKNSSDVMPSIPDVLLRKLRVHKSLPGSSPPLTEKEVENVFVQLSLAFRNDSYTLEARINQAERERNLTEENAEKELENFKAAITSSAALWHHYEHREAYQKLLEDIAVLRRLAARLSSRAEMVGAVRQEKRMSKATEVMMQYVENLKRTYEKDHAELMEFKKLANQNSSRSYGASEDGVPRSSRSMSLTVGKNMPRRRVSVAVVPKFNSLNIPGQSPTASPIPSVPSLSESPNNGRSNLTSTPVLPALLENGKSNGEPDCEASTSMLTQSGLEEINPETKAKIEEEAYNKGYQEGLKKIKELQELKEEDEEAPKESPDEHEESENEDEIKNLKSRLEVIINYLHILYPKLCKHWNVVWLVVAAIIIFAVVLWIYHSYNSCDEISEGPEGKASCSAAHQYSWWNSGFQHEQRTE
ncbi:inositol 1,4,5-triphosphate receptor associated 1 isoform X3 [Struthio camelus]|uniref:inositol 1,4,5-triphosphate receptor associated 1 isoform X3 n=1 Tax=Struthio camelus TaxID=8801 RepID=UPI0036041699